MTSSGNPHEHYARLRKARALLDELDRVAFEEGAGVTVDSLARMDWPRVAKQAGVNPPSEDTIVEVKKRVEARRRKRT